MNKRLMFHVEHQFNLLKVQLINKYEFKNQITMLIILLKTTLMKNINHIINISIIKTVDIYVSRETINQIKKPLKLIMITAPYNKIH